MYRIFLTLTLMLILFPTMGHACLGPMAHTQTFLNNLPNEVLTEEIVARIIVLETMLDDFSRLSQVEVVDAVKGTEIGDMLIVQSNTHSCAQDFEIKRGDEYYIAGSLNDEKIFVGEWRGDANFTNQFEKIEAQ